MGNNSYVFAIAMLCVLVMAVASNTSSGMKHRTLMEEDKGDGKHNEPQKVVSSPPPISPPFRSTAPDGNNSPPQSDQSPQKSNNSDHASPNSPPLANSSAKLVPPPGPENLNSLGPSQGEDNTSQNPPTKEEHRAPEAPKKEGDKPVRSPGQVGDHKAPQVPHKFGDKAPQARKDDNVPEGSGRTSKSGSPDDNNKNESCGAANASNIRCQKGVLVACLLQPGTESTQLFLLAQNTGANDLNLNLTSPGKIKIDSKSLNLPKHSNKKVNLNADTSRGLKIILSIKEGDCVLETQAFTSDWFPLQQFPAYAAQVRPMHGAYFLFATIIIVGGTWACCKFRKMEKRIDAGIPYQQLEMATHTPSASAYASASASASLTANEATAGGWDQGWDDDWDDEETAVVRTSGKQPTDNVPSNGLSSRSANPNKDGWENDWDD